eukprot:scaffold49026_cov29-Tisochrysis_lutea.AAC.1
MKIWRRHVLVQEGGEGRLAAGPNVLVRMRTTPMDRILSTERTSPVLHANDSSYSEHASQTGPVVLVYHVPEPQRRHQRQRNERGRRGSRGTGEKGDGRREVEATGLVIGVVALNLQIYFFPFHHVDINTVLVTASCSCQTMSTHVSHVATQWEKLSHARDPTNLTCSGLVCTALSSLARGRWGSSRGRPKYP